jgi:hypothetical protein
LDEVESYFGLRSVGFSSQGLLLNGQPYYLRSVLDQGYWCDTHLANPGTQWLRDEVELMKSMGFNSVRVHQKAEDPRFLYWTDRLGLLVWAETANARGFSPRAVELLTREWTDLVLRDRSHPSVAVWVPVNESWGVGKLAVDPAQQAYVADLASLTRALDPTRPVISNDGWEHVDSDILGIHDYTAKPRWIRRRYGNRARVTKTLRSGRPGGKKLIVTAAQRLRWDAGELPVMLTEFGGVSYAGEQGWGYTTVSSAEEYETNGLLTDRREPKLPLETIRSIVEGAPATA